MVSLGALYFDALSFNSLYTDYFSNTCPVHFSLCFDLLSSGDKLT